MRNARRIGIALLCGTGLVLPAVPASADGFDIGFGFGGGHRHRSHRSRHRGHGDDAVAAGVGFLAGLVVGAVIEDATRPRRVVYAPPPVMYAPPPAYVAAGPAPTAPMGYAPAYAPAPAPAVGYAAPALAPHACACCCRVYVPPCTVWRERTVCGPALYEDRCVPVFEDVEVPIHEEVRVPICEERCDPATGTWNRVQVGERLERRQVGMRLDRVRVGDRVERVLVRPETTRTVRVPETVPGHYVTVCETPGHRHDGEVLTRKAYESVVTVEAAPR